MYILIHCNASPRVTHWEWKHGDKTYGAGWRWSTILRRHMIKPNLPTNSINFLTGYAEMYNLYNLGIAVLAQSDVPVVSFYHVSKLFLNYSMHQWFLYKGSFTSHSSMRTNCWKQPSNLYILFDPLHGWKDIHPFIHPSMRINVVNIPHISSISCMGVHSSTCTHASLWGDKYPHGNVHFISLLYSHPSYPLPIASSF